MLSYSKKFVLLNVGKVLIVFSQLISLELIFYCTCGKVSFPLNGDFYTLLPRMFYWSLVRIDHFKMLILAFTIYFKLGKNKTGSI